MPVLSINFVISSVRGVYLNSEGGLTNFMYRYPYSEDLYSHFYSKHDYYSDLVDYFFKELNIDADNVQVIATGHPEVPTIRQKVANATSYDQVIKKVDRFDVVGITDSTVFTQKQYRTQYNIDKLKFGVKEKNYLLNLALYNNVIPEKPSEYNLMLASIWNMLNIIETNTEEVKIGMRPILFMGDVFSFNNLEFRKISYLYILSFIVNPGVYYVGIDKNNDLAHFTHLKTFNKELSYLYDQFTPHNLGTLVNAPEETTCLIKHETGNDQLIEVPSGRIFFVPLAENKNTRIVLKNKYLGNVEKVVTGGKLGLILDTRLKHDKTQYDYEQLQMDINANLKSIDEVMKQI